MAKILSRTELIPGQTTKLVLDAPDIAAKARPGNFVILRVHGQGERIPLTIADADADLYTDTDKLADARGSMCWGGGTQVL